MVLVLIHANGDGLMDEYGLSFLTGNGSDYLTVINSFGGKIIDIKGKPSYGKKPAIDALKLLADMTKLKGMCFYSDWNLDSPNGRPFYTGKVAMSLLWNCFVDGLQGEYNRVGINVKLGMTSVPRGPKGSIPMVNGPLASMFKKANNKPAASVFIQYLMSSEFQIMKMKGDWMLPTNLEALMSKEVVNFMPSWYRNSYRNGVPESLNPNFAKVSESMWDNLNQVTTGKITLNELISRGSR